MKKLSRPQVEQRAENILAEHGLDRPPINVERLARRLGYRVIYQHMPGDISGSVTRDEDASITIGINSFHANVRQRFSIAHELGHARLHASPEKHTFVDPPAKVLFRDGISSLGEDPREIEANQFAAALLMPKHLVMERGQNLIDRNRQISVDALVDGLARTFDVSPQAMRYRLVTFGVLEPE